MSAVYTIIILALFALGMPVAFVLSEAPEAEHPGLIERVLATCRAKLADFKVPVQVIVVDELPRGTLEKVSKVTLRQRLEG